MEQRASDCRQHYKNQTCSFVSSHPQKVNFITVFTTNNPGKPLVLIQILPKMHCYKAKEWAQIELLFTLLSTSAICQSSTNNAPPTEEELISRLLKSPGLPPGAPPSIADEVPPPADESNLGQQKGSHPELAPPPIVAASVPNSLPVLGHSSSSRGSAPSAAPPSYIQCLLQIEARVCDADNILSSQERVGIDDTLRELETATRKEGSANECDRTGLKLMVILVRHSALLNDPMNSVQKKLNDALDVWVRDPEHKCQKPVILMLSADSQMVNRRVWTGRHFDVPVMPSELVQLFMAQDELTRKEKYGEVILNIIEGLLSRYEQRALKSAH